jgi:EAL domain-containing protein (putative c-di-GMP-specific phosphodiesterase class I)
LVILAADVTNRPTSHPVLTVVTRNMIDTLVEMGVTVGAVDVPSIEAAATWHAMGVSIGQGDFAGPPDDLGTLLGQRSGNGA